MKRIYLLATLVIATYLGAQPVEWSPQNKNSVLALAAPRLGLTDAGTAGDFWLDARAPFTTAGVQLIAHSAYPNIVAKLGTATGGSVFAVLNSANTQLLEVTGDGQVRATGSMSSMTSLSATKEFSVDFTAANQAADVYLTGSQAYWGVLDVDITDSFNGQNAAGLIRRRYYLGLTPGTVYKNDSRYVDEGGATPDNYAISALSWDSANSRYRITIAHRAGTANSPRVRLTAYAARSFYVDEFLTFTMGAAYSTDTSTYVRPYVSFPDAIAVGSNNAPTAALDVNGDVKANGKILGKYQDVAEWVPAQSDLPAGTVVTLDRTQRNRVIPSDTAYDTKVAGVVSAQPGIILGEPGTEKAAVANSGRVRVLVDATSGPIAIGDLLVSSSVTGHAMRSEPLTIKGRRFHQPGTIIGKALERLEKGQGEILVLLTLQ